MPPVEVVISCKAFLTSSISRPESGPKANAPMSAGKSDKSIFAKDGDSGTGNSTKASTYALAESSAVMVMVRILKAAALFVCCMVIVRFIMLLS